MLRNKTRNLVTETSLQMISQFNAMAPDQSVSRGFSFSLPADLSAPCLRKETERYGKSPGRNNEKKGIFDIASSCRIVYFRFNIMIIGVLIVVTVKAHKKPKSTHINSFHVITMRWWVLFTVPRRRRKTITRKKNNNHKMNEKCSVGSSREVILPDIFASSSHTAGDCDHPKNYVHLITWQRYESRLVKSKNEIKFKRLIYFQLLNFFYDLLRLPFVSGLFSNDVGEW